MASGPVAKYIQGVLPFSSQLSGQGDNIRDPSRVLRNSTENSRPLRLHCGFDPKANPCSPARHLEPPSRSIAEGNLRCGAAVTVVLYYNILRTVVCILRHHQTLKYCTHQATYLRPMCLESCQFPWRNMSPFPPIRTVRIRTKEDIKCGYSVDQYCATY